MSDSYAYRIRTRAIREITLAAANGYEHYGDERAEVEINHALVLITAHPYIGHPAPRTKLEGVRRLLLRELRAHLYYQVDDENRFVTILTLWPTSRGAGPGI